MGIEIPLVYSKYDSTTDTSTLTRALTFNGETVPQHFTTNFTTTYWFIRWFVPRFGRGNVPAVIHDWQYVNPLFKSRSIADDNYRKALIAVGFHPLRARLHWVGVRIGGYKVFNDGGKQRLNPKVITRIARAASRETANELDKDVAIMVERCSGIIPGVTRPKE